MFKKLLLTGVILPAMAIAAQAENFESIDAGNVAVPPIAEEGKSAGAAVKKDACADDPRLVTDIIEIMQADKPVIKPPMTVTPETYLTLDSEVLEKLAGQMIICPNNPVMKNGKPVRKIAIDFQPLYEHIIAATVAGDNAKLKKLLNGFSVNNLPPQELFKLVTGTINLDGKKLGLLYQTAGMNPNAEFLKPIDLFLLLGGKSTEKAIVYLIKFNEEPEISEADSANSKEIPVYTLNDLSHTVGPAPLPYVSKRLTAAGLITR